VRTYSPRKSSGRPSEIRVVRESRSSVKESKALFVLQAFTAGEIQSYISQKVPYKVGRKPHSPIIKHIVHTPGSGIPASTIHRFQNGTYKKMGPVTISKLAVVYEKYHLVYLRSIGSNREESKLFCRLPPEKLRPKLYNYISNARRIQYNYRQQGVHKILYYIQWGMAHSKHKSSEWDKIAAISGLSKYKPPRKRRKKGYGSHRE